MEQTRYYSTNYDRRGKMWRVQEAKVYEGTKFLKYNINMGLVVEILVYVALGLLSISTFLALWILVDYLRFR